jgi:hypothetical protein
MAHAILSPSAASRWLTCTPSARLELNFENTESDFAREGTLAHAICECLLNGYLASGSPFLTIAEWKYFKDQEFYTEAMYEHCQAYASYVLSFFAEGDILRVEDKINLSAFVPESFGTSDSWIYKTATKHLHVLDLKYGKGVPVSADSNKQLKLYALGILEELLCLYDVETVTLHIYQPRIQNNSDFTISVKDLLAWRKKIEPLAKLAFDGEGEFVAGDHCLFCRAKATCRAIAEYNTELAKHDFKDPNLLDDEEIIEVIERKSIFESWIKAVSEHALSEAVKGKNWPGYKLVEGKADRKYKDENEIVRTLTKHLNFGYVSEIYKPQQLLGITELTKKLGTENFNTYVAPLLIKPKGAPTLVPESDKRSVFSNSQSDFNDGFSEEDSWDI